MLTSWIAIFYDRITIFEQKCWALLSFELEKCEKSRHTLVSNGVLTKLLPKDPNCFYLKQAGNGPRPANLANYQFVPVRVFSTYWLIIDQPLQICSGFGVSGCAVDVDHVPYVVSVFASSDSWAPLRKNWKKPRANISLCTLISSHMLKWMLILYDLKSILFFN